MKAHKYKLNTASKRRISRKLNRGIVKVCKNILAAGIIVLIALFLYPKGLLTDFTVFYHSIYQKIDLKLENINISGNEKIPPERIKNLAALHVGQNLLEIDLDKMQKNLSQEPWIKTLVIYRQFPSSINIVIEEEKPYALYEENGIMSFVTQQGKILEEINESVNLPDYLIVSGKNANLGYNALLDIVYKYPEIYDQLLGLEKVGERRWNLKLENNTIIKLPEHNIELALDIFHDLFEKTPYQLSYIVDLRLIPDKIYMKVL